MRSSRFRFAASAQQALAVLAAFILMAMSTTLVDAFEVTDIIHSFGRSKAYSLVDIPSNVSANGVAACAATTLRGQPGVLAEPNTVMKQNILTALGDDRYPAAGFNLVVVVNGRLTDGNWTWPRYSTNFSSEDRTTCFSGTCWWADSFDSAVVNGTYMVAEVGTRTGTTFSGNWTPALPGRYYDLSKVQAMVAFCEYRTPGDQAPYSLAAEKPRIASKEPTMMKHFTYSAIPSFGMRTIGWAPDVGQALLERANLNPGLYLYTLGDVKPVLVVGRPASIAALLTRVVASACNNDYHETPGLLTRVLDYTSSDTARAMQPWYRGAGEFIFPNGRQIHSVRFDMSGEADPVLSVLVGSPYCPSSSSAPRLMTAGELGSDARSSALGEYNHAVIATSRNALYLAGTSQVISVDLDTFTTALFAGTTDAFQFVDSAELVASRTDYPFDFAHSIVWDETETHMYATLPNDLNIMRVSTVTDQARTLYGTDSAATVQWFRGVVFSGFDYGMGELYPRQMVHAGTRLVFLIVEGTTLSKLGIIDIVKRTEYKIDLKDSGFSSVITGQALGLAATGPDGRFHLSTSSDRLYAMELGGTDTLTVSLSSSHPSSTTSKSLSPSGTVLATNTASTTSTQTASASLSRQTVTRSGRTVSATVTRVATRSASATAVPSTTFTLSSSYFGSSITRTPSKSHTASLPLTVTVPATPTTSMSSTATLPGTASLSRSRDTRSRTRSVNTASYAPSESPSGASLSWSPSVELTASASPSTSLHPDSISRTATVPTPSKSSSPTAERSESKATESSSVTVDADSPTVSASASAFIELPQLSGDAANVSLRVSLKAVETTGATDVFITVSGAEWNSLLRPLGRHFQALASAVQDTGVPLCSASCIVTHVSPEQYFTGEVLGCNASHLRTRIEGRNAFPRGRKRPVMRGTMSLAHECLRRRPSTSQNLTAAFVIDDDRAKVPQVVSEEVVQTAETAVAVASVTSVVVANPTIATQMNRITMVLSLAYCEGEFDEAEFAENPFGIVIDGAEDRETGTVIGAAVSGVLILLMCFAAQLLFGSAWHAYNRCCKSGPRKVTKTFAACVADTRCPGMLVVPLLMFLEAIVKGGLVGIVHVGSGVALATGVVTLAIVSTLVVATGIILFCHLHCHRKEVGTGLTAEEEEEARVDANVAEIDSLLVADEKPSKDRPPPESKSKDPNARCCVAPSAEGVKSFLFGTGKWCNDDDMVEHGIKFTRHFGFLVVDYRGGTSAFIFVEILLGVFAGALEAVNPNDELSCKIVAWITAALFTFYAIALIVLRPYCVPFHTVVFTPCAAVQAAGAVMIATYLMVPEQEWLLNVGSWLPLAAGVGLMLKELADLVLMFLEGVLRFHAHITKRPSSWMRLLDTRHLHDEEDMHEATVDDANIAGGQTGAAQGDATDTTALLVVPLTEQRAQQPSKPGRVHAEVDAEGNLRGTSAIAAGDLKYNAERDTWMVRAPRSTARIDLLQGAASRDPWAGYVPTRYRPPSDEANGVGNGTDAANPMGGQPPSADKETFEEAATEATADTQLAKSRAMHRVELLDSEASARDTMRQELLEKLGGRALADVESDVLRDDQQAASAGGSPATALRPGRTRVPLFGLQPKKASASLPALVEIDASSDDMHPSDLSSTLTFEDGIDESLSLLGPSPRRGVTRQQEASTLLQLAVPQAAAELGAGLRHPESDELSDDSYALL